VGTDQSVKRFEFDERVVQTDGWRVGEL
jgi:hypothetical protein